MLTLSGCTTSTARLYTFFTCSGVTRSAMLTGFHLVSPAHSTVCIVERSALIFLSLPSIHSRICKCRGIKKFRRSLLGLSGIPPAPATSKYPRPPATPCCFLYLESFSTCTSCLLFLVNSSSSFKSLLRNFILFPFESLNPFLSAPPQSELFILKVYTPWGHTPCLFWSLLSNSPWYSIRQTNIK